MGAVYSKSSFFKYMMLLMLVMLSMMATQGSGFLIVVPLVLAALIMRRSMDMYFYMMLAVAMMMGNQTLMPKNAVFAFSQRGLLMLMGFCLSMQVFGLQCVENFRSLRWIFPYLIFMLLSSTYGWNPMISYMKLLLFTLVFLAYYGCSNQLVKSGRDCEARVRSIVLAFSAFFVVGSAILIRFPAIGQMSGEEYVELLKAGGGAHMTSLFKGMTMHSQSLGPSIAIIATVLLGDLVFSVKRFDPLYVLMLVLSPVIIYYTSSRTAMGSFMVGVLAVCFFGLRDKMTGQKIKRKIVSFGMLGAMAMGVLLIYSSDMQVGVKSFAVKFREVGVDERVELDEILVTRQGKWDEGIYNFKRSPVIGNGFQVSEAMVGFDAGLSTLSAPVEKSVWISAVLEEGGVIGFGMFLIFVLASISSFVKTRSYVGAAAFVVLMTANLGEFTIFSLSYTGGLLWAMVFAGLVLDVFRKKREAYFHAG